MSEGGLARPGLDERQVASMSLVIPERLSEKWQGRSDIATMVHGAIDRLCPWMERNHTPLFPEYTDHGVGHLGHVLDGACALVTDGAWELLTAEDAALLVVSTLLHDCAMHLTEVSFQALVSGKAEQRAVVALDREEWPALWEAYLRESKRWDARQITRLFGADERPRVPPEDTARWSKLDRMFCGEFLRRHHARFAHEVALHGVPGANGTPAIAPDAGTRPELADLAGVLARSHGLAFRSVVDYLRREYGRADKCRNAHVSYLAALLRVADYLDLSPGRAPLDKIRMTRLLSPVSEREWRANQAVRDADQDEYDPKAVWVDARPTNVATYLRLREWLDGVQAELDMSWAVLGEVYGRRGDLSKLGLTVRRITSNLDDLDVFAESVDYVPARVGLTVARKQVLAHLTGPLYGHDPAIGIRELLQNALDAVRELRDYRERHPDGPEPDTAALEDGADVEIWVGRETERGTVVTVTDRGIGMTANTVRDYFLAVGATYRDSDDWRALHLDEEGAEPKSRVLRSGRFGVGVLAGFLLGDEIRVTTRHISQRKGLRFVLRPDDDEIELRHCDACIGTTVEVAVLDGVVKALSDSDLWDWYALDDPKVVRRWGPGGLLQPQEERLPAAGAELPVHWRRISADGYEDVQWTVSGAKLWCNGIRIEAPEDSVRGEPSHVFRVASTVLAIMPTVSVFDSDGLLPLNLTRDGFAEAPSFADDLRADLARCILAYLLHYLPADPLPGPWYGRGLVRVPYALRQAGSSYDSVFATRRGYCLAETVGEALGGLDGPIVCATLGRGRTLRGLARAGAIDAQHAAAVVGLRDSLFERVRRAGTAWAACNLAAARLVSDHRYPLNRLAAWGLVPVSDASAWGPDSQVWETPRCPATCVSAGWQSTARRGSEIVELFPKCGFCWPDGDELVRRVWRETLGQATIPFSEEERREQLGDAYRDLEPYAAMVRAVVERDRGRGDRVVTR